MFRTRSNQYKSPIEMRILRTERKIRRESPELRSNHKYASKLRAYSREPFHRQTATQTTEIGENVTSGGRCDLRQKSADPSKPGGLDPTGVQ
jgi:hypothetical protein